MTNMFSNAVWTVGKAVRNMASSVLDWNTSTFSGAVDIIVVRHRTENGFIYKCTPFHVKFGILQVLKSSERVVNIEINGQPSPLKMKLSKNGFAYFADEEDWYCESVEEDVVSENSESSGKTKENKENNLRRVKSLTDIVKIKREKDYPKSIEHANKYSNQIEDRLQISKLQLSLCGEDLNLGENRRLPISECKLLFEKSKIKIDDFLENPKIVFNEKLAVLFGNQVYPGSAFVPFVIGAMTFGSDKFDISSYRPIVESEHVLNTEKDKFEDIERNKFEDIEKTSKTPKTTQKNTKTKKRKHKKRSIRPTSDQIFSLNLRKGANIARFAVHSALQGTQIIEAAIYLWDEDARIVVSDIDGTITKSDMLGFILPNFGRSWEQPDVARLFRSVHENGYNIVYLTARLISLTEMTRRYLFGLDQSGGEQLPVGPILTFPMGFISAYRRDHISQPQIMKINILKEIQKLFPESKNPFYAGFGNTETDTISYKTAKIPKARIFIINKTGEIIKHSARHSYGSFAESVNQMFPPIDETHLNHDVKFGINFWKNFNEISLETIEEL